MRISLDTETTGLDLHSWASAFLVTICKEDGEQLHWEWPVDLETRYVTHDPDDLEEIRAEIEAADAIIFQNAKFDVTALHYAFGGRLKWPWHKTHDTLMAGHLLASNHPHGLYEMAIEYLNVDLHPYEDELEKAVLASRKAARQGYLDVSRHRLTQGEKTIIAKEGQSLEGIALMPSVKGGSKRVEERAWKADCWMPRAILEWMKNEARLRPDKLSPFPPWHPWWTVCADYANADSWATMELFKVMEKQLKDRGLWAIYLERMKLIPIAFQMQFRGLTYSGSRLQERISSFTQERDRLAEQLVSYASSRGHRLVLPKGASPNQSLHTFIYDVMCLPGAYNTKSLTGKPSLNKKAKEGWLSQLPHGSGERTFVENLLKKSKLDTALSYMEGYRRFELPHGKFKGWYLLHPELNPTGTHTLRWSSYNPNEQNISKQSGAEGANYNIRYCFGPAPGREWWSMDAQNLELRIPAFESQEEDLMEVFNHPEKPPYYGSYHLLVADLLHPALFKKHGKNFKEVFKSTWYQWVKNGNFAIIYGAQEGTADLTYQVSGAYQKIMSRFPKIKELGDKMLFMAEMMGYVQTIPDKNVDPEHGYPLLCARDTWGKVLSTVPLNYHVQGTACWWMGKAMVRCFEQLQEWTRQTRSSHAIALQVHDELVFDLPRGTGKEPWRTNWGKIQVLKQLMERGGEDIGVPTPVSITYHGHDWSDGITDFPLIT